MGKYNNSITEIGQHLKNGFLEEKFIRTENMEVKVDAMQEEEDQVFETDRT